MNFNEFSKFRDSEIKSPLITIKDLENKSDRTLIYGYTCDRDTFHVYIKYEHIFVIIYNYELVENKEYIIDNSDYTPNKRLYPSACDYEFCDKLYNASEYMSFTNFDHDREHKIYHGKLLEDFI